MCDKPLYMLACPVGELMTKLEYLRRSRGLTQMALGETLGYVGGGQISRLEKYVPPPDKVSFKLRVMLEKFFELPIEELLKPVGPSRV